MFFIERNRKINEIDDLRAFTTAQSVRIEESRKYSSGRLEVMMYLTGRSGPRTVESRIYKLNLQPLPRGGYEVYNAERVYKGNINDNFGRK